MTLESSPNVLLYGSCPFPFRNVSKTGNGQNRAEIIVIGRTDHESRERRRNLLFNGDQFSRLNASSQQDRTVGPIPKLLDCCVPIHGAPALSGHSSQGRDGPVLQQ